MAASRKILPALLAGATAAAVVPLTVGAATGPTVHQAALRDFPTFVFATIAEGDLRGSVAAVQRSSAPRASVFVSLHGLTPSSAYSGAIADVPCGREAPNNRRILDLLGVVRTEAGQDDFFENKTGKLKKRLARGTTVRIYRGGNEIACARANRVR